MGCTGALVARSSSTDLDEPTGFPAPRSQVYDLGLRLTAVAPAGASHMPSEPPGTEGCWG